MISRGGLEAACAARQRTLALLSGDPFPHNAAICRLDDAFIQSNLSPGGCADLLAATLFLHALETQAEI
jgi:triphosphoribosyl-dephospho-CoA synthetase